MRLAIVSDIHGNWQAWRAVLRDIQACGADGLLCLGDIVGYGPRPADVLEDVLSVCDNVVLGNHDAVIANRLDPEIFSDQAREAIEWTRGRLGPGAAEFFARLPMAMENDDILCVHAEAEDPERYDYIFDADDAMPSFGASTAGLILCGHTHVPRVFVYDEEMGVAVPAPVGGTVLRPGYRYLVNVGSVGDSRDGNERACYCILDREKRSLEFRRAAFDCKAYRRELEATGLSTIPYFLQALDDKLQDASRLSDMDTRRLKRAQGEVRARTHAAQIEVDPGLLHRIRRDRMVVPTRKPLSRKGKIAAWCAGGAAALLLGTGMVWMACQRNASRSSGVTWRMSARVAAELSQGRPAKASAHVAGADVTSSPTFSTTNYFGGSRGDVAGRQTEDATTTAAAEAVETADEKNRAEVTSGEGVAAKPKGAGVGVRSRPVDAADTPHADASFRAAVAAFVDVGELLVYDGFNYPAGKLAGRRGGIGWTGAWVGITGSGGSVAAGSLARDKNPTGPAEAEGRARLSDNSRIGRHLDTAEGGVFDRSGYLDENGVVGADGKTIYVSFLQRTERTARYWEFELHRGDLNDRGRVSGIGNDWRGNDLHLRGGRNPKIAAADSRVNFFVLRIDFKPGNDDVRVFINPPWGGVEPAVKAAALNAPAHRDMSFDGVSLASYMGAAAVEHDAVRIGRTYASVTSPPGSIPAGVAALVCRRDFDAAVTVWARLNPHHADLDVLRGLERRLSNREETVLESFRHDVGQEVPVLLAGGRKLTLLIEDVREKTIRCTLDANGKRITKDLVLDDLHANERLRRLGGDDAVAAWVHKGLLALESGRPDVARQALEQVQGDLGEALVTQVGRIMDDRLRLELNAVLSEIGIPLQSDALEDAATHLLDNPPSPMTQRRLLAALKRYRANADRQGGFTRELELVLSGIEAALGEHDGHAGVVAPVAHWPMDALSGTGVKDKIGSHHGIMYGKVERRRTTARGCLEFDGESYVDIDETEGLAPGRSLTWVAWIRTTRDGTIMAFTARGGDWTTGGRSLYVEGDALVFSAGGAGTVRSEVNLADGKWHQVVVTVDGGRDVALYVDGESCGGGNLPRTVGRLPAGAVFRVGYTNGNFPRTPGLTGLIDDVMCYDLTLSASQIRRLYEDRKRR